MEGVAVATPNGLESQRLGPAWFAVCTAAGVDPNRYRVIGIWAWWGFSYEIMFLLSPLAAPFVVPAAARASEMYADRIAFDLGYGPALAEVFTGREYQRAQSWAAAPQQGLKDSQPLDSARLRGVERLLASGPPNGHQPPC